MTPVIQLRKLLKKIQITSFHSVAPTPFGEKHLSFGLFHLVELRISIIAPVVPAIAPVAPAIAPVVPAIAPIAPAIAPVVPAIAPVVPAIAPVALVILPVVSDIAPVKLALVTAAAAAERVLVHLEAQLNAKHACAYATERARWSVKAHLDALATLDVPGLCALKRALHNAADHAYNV